MKDLLDLKHRVIGRRQPNAVGDTLDLSGKVLVGFNPQPLVIPERTWSSSCIAVVVAPSDCLSHCLNFLDPVWT